MRTRFLITLAAGSMLGTLGLVQQSQRLNPVIELLAQKKPVFGLYAPANPRAGRGAGGGRGAAQAGGTAGAATATPPVAQPATPPAPVKTPAELAQSAVEYKFADYIFDGSMEGDARFDQSQAAFADFTRGMVAAGFLRTTPTRRLTHPLFVKTPIIAKDTVVARARIERQLNMGVSGIVFTGVESANEVKQGLAMMRFKSKGGTRSDNVGDAPAAWGMTEKEYKEKADLWPLNPNGELVNFTIVESKEGLAHIREIAAVKGIGVLFPGAGTLGGVFSTTDSTGRRVRDNVAWEASIQQVLSACKEFNVPCGYPANDSTMMKTRMEQGFSVFISNWGETGFKAVEAAKKVGGQP